MAVTTYASGTQTATVTTEHTLSSVTAAGVYVLEVDVNAMAVGDVLELRCYSIAVTGGTSREEWCIRFYGDQTRTPMKRGRPVSNDITDTDALKFTLKQTFGTGRSFPWKVMKHA